MSARAAEPERGPLPWRERAVIRGGTRVLRALTRTWRVREIGREGWNVRRAAGQGTVVAVTPDGPRGPQHSVAPGTLVAAQRAGVPVIGMVAHVDRVWRLNSWDRFEIPQPFARITIAYTAPFVVPGRTPAEAAAATEAFAREMEQLADRARASA